MQIIDFLNAKKIKWFPIYIELINGKKHINSIKHYEIMGYKMDMNDFNTLDNNELKTRQSLISKSDYIAIDTNEVQQIDIDDTELTKEDLDMYCNNSLYYFSVSKKLPHIFCYLEDAKDFSKREKHINNRNIEVLNGQWSFCDKHTKVFNTDKEIQILKKEFIGYKKMNEAFNELSFYNNDINDIKELLNIIDKKYIDDRDSWLKIGAAMFNLGLDFSLFDELSKKADNYGGTQEAWNSFNSNPLTTIKFGTICYYAKISNEKKFNKIRIKLSTNIQLNEIDTLLKTGYITHSKIAKIFYERFKDKYSYSCGVWYRLNNGGIYEAMVKDADKILIKELKDYIQPYILNIIQKTTDDIHRKKLWEVNSKIENISFKKSCIDEAHNEFIDEKLQENLDTNINLIGFNNGVYDLEKMEFRKGTIQDKVSMCIGYDYENLSNYETLDFLEKTLDDMFETKEMSHWFKIHLGSLLQGINIEEKVYFWVGDGRNGKGTIDKLLIDTLGDYYTNLNNKYFTTSSKDGSAAAPDLLKLKNKRVSMTHEPEGEEKYLTSKFKLVSGNDKIEARGLYSNNYHSFDITFKPVIQTNHLPKFTDIDDGLLNRLVVIQFPFKFLDITTYDENNKYHKKQDNTLKQKLKNSNLSMFHLMLKYYKIYKQDGLLHFPKEVKKGINAYKKQVDTIGAFIEDVLVKTDSKNDTIDFNYLYLLFNRYIGDEKINKNKFSTGLARHSINTARYRINGKQKTGLEYYKLNAEWLEENNFNDDDDL
jgi:P4 family phage/plasmid primase-like protien